MTEAMPFLQKAILLSYDPRPFGGELFVHRTASGVCPGPAGAAGSTCAPAKNTKNQPPPIIGRGLVFYVGWELTYRCTADAAPPDSQRGRVP